MPKGSGIMMDAKIEGMDELLAKLRAMDGAVKAAVKAAVLAGAGEMAGQIGALAPKPEVGIRLVSVNAQRGEVVAEIGPVKKRWAWQFLETGAKPHVIPKKKKSTLLAFEGRGGRLVRARAVMHPGMAPRPFVLPGFERAAASGSVEATVGDVLRRAVEP